MLLKKSIPRAWKRLDKPLHPAEGLPQLEGKPSNYMDDEEALEIILQHVKSYAEFKNTFDITAHNLDISGMKPLE